MRSERLEVEGATAGRATAPQEGALRGSGGECSRFDTGSQDAQSLLAGLRALLGQWDSQGPRGGVARAWGQGCVGGVREPPRVEQPGTVGGTLPATVEGAAVSGAVPDSPGAPAAAGSGEQLTSGVVPDAAQRGAYVSFAGPLGTHVKKEVRERIWKGEFVEIFSLLPLEESVDLKDEDKKDGKKEEEERSKRYRKIPKTFGNWLRAFCTLASIIGEKHPERCSPLFCYLDGIWEAYRVYGGLAWWRYDEQFRQRLAANPGMRWDQLDMPLWLRLMTAQKASPFQRSAGGAQQGSSSAVNRPGYCWQFNEGQCKWGTSCKYKHECSGCGGAHPHARCFKKGKGVAKSAEAPKGEDSGEPRRDAALARPLR